MSSRGNQEGPDTRRALLGTDPWPFRLYSSLMVLVVLGLTTTLLYSRAWKGWGPFTVLFWIGLSAVSDFLPVGVTRNFSVSMSGPVNIAIAYLFPPPLAAPVVFVGAHSEWELKRETTLLHAIFDRAQIALSTALASFLFHVASSRVSALWTLIAVFSLHTSNLVSVMIAERTARGTPLLEIGKRLLASGIPGTLVYMAVDSIGIVLALTYRRVGPWAVVLLMIPLLVTRYALRTSRDLHRVESDLRALSDRLVHERERERLRIAGDLHDLVLQELAALQLHADNIVSAAGSHSWQQAREMAEKVREGIRATVDDLREAISSLRTTALESEGLVATVYKYSNVFSAKTGIDATATSTGLDPNEIPLPVAILAYECCREALTNVAKHSHATKVEVELLRDGNFLELAVKDNGIGLQKNQGLGLGLATDKVALAGGSLLVNSQVSGGAEVRVKLPMRADPWLSES